MDEFIREDATIDSLTGKVWSVTMLRQGFNKDRSRFYSEEALRSFASLANMQSVPCMADHMSPTEFMQHPAGSVKEVVGGYSNVAYDPTSKTVRGELNFLEEGNPYPHIPKAVKEAHEGGMPTLYQISINARPGMRRRTQVQGYNTELVDSFTRITSTDLVTHGGAGGTIDAILEDERGEDMTKEELEAAMKDLTPEQLKEFIEANHPELLTVTETEEPGPDDNVTEVVETPDFSAMVTEAVTAAVTPLKEENDRLSSEMKKTQLNVQLDADGSKLPELVVTRIKNEIGDGRIIEAENLKSRIEEEAQIYSAIANVPAMTDFGEMAEGDRNEDHLAKAFIATFKGSEYEGVKPLSGIQEMYHRASEMSGRRVPYLPKNVLATQIIKESKNYDSAGMMEQLNAAGMGNSNVQEAINMSSFGVLLGDSMNKAFLDLYAGLEEMYGDWRKILSKFQEVSRFDEFPVSRLGLYGRYPIVLEGGTYNPGATVTEEAIRLQVVKTGRTEALTMEAIADDDLGKLQSIPMRLAHGGHLGRYRDIFDMFRENNGAGPTMPYNSRTMLHDNNYNKPSGFQQFSSAAAYSGFLKMRQNRDQDSDETNLGIKARYVIVPLGILSQANQVYEQDYEHVPVSGAGSSPPTNTNTETMNKNYAKGLMEPMDIPYWGGTGASNSNWYLVADPGMYDTIQMNYYTGHANPQIETQDGSQSDTVFYTETLVIKSRDIRDQKVVDHRAFYGSFASANTSTNN